MSGSQLQEESFDSKPFKCLHSSCLVAGQCLDCGKEFVLPKVSTKSLVESAPEFGVISSEGPQGKVVAPLCDFCEETKAAVHCAQCQQFFCGGCQKARHQTKAATHHVFLTLGEFVKRDPKVPLSFCPQHPASEVTIFCRDCGVSICPQCAVPLHLGHDFALLEDMVPGLVDSFEGTLDNAKIIETVIAQAVEEAKLRLNSLNFNDQTTTEAIFSQFEKIKRDLDRRQNQILADLEATFRQKEKKLKTQAIALEVYRGGLQSAIEYAEGLLQGGNVVKILENRPQVLERLQNLSQQIVELQAFCDGNLTFISNFHRDELSNAIQAFGAVEGDLSDISPQDCYLERTLKGGKFKVLTSKSFSTLIVSGGQDGKELTMGGKKLDVDLEGPSKDLRVNVQDNQDGTYRVSFTPDRAGTYKVNIKISGKPIRDSPFSVEAIDKPGARDPTSIFNAILRFGAIGNEDGQFKSLQGICVNSRGEIIVADRGNHRIQIFTKDGQFLRQFGSYSRDSGRFNLPEGVAVNTEDHIYVTERSGHRIQIFDSNGQYLRQFGKEHGSENDQFSSPTGIAIDPQNGNILVAEFGTHQVQVFDSQGQSLWEFGRGILSSPIGIAINSRREIFVSDYNSHRVHVFDENGDILRIFGNGQLAYPRYLCVDGDDNLYVCCEGNNKVFVYDRKGQFLHSFTNERMLHPNGIAFNPVDGSLVVGGENGHIFIF